MPSGIPISFRCPRWRHSRVPYWHEIVRTGRKRPSKSRRGHGISLLTAYEYRCTCGYVGWTTHPQILQKRFASMEDAST